MRLLCLLLCVGSLFADPSIVFVHLGPRMPDYLPVAVNQAKLFNPEVPVYVVASQSAFAGAQRELRKSSFIKVTVESLNISGLHQAFLKKSKRARRSGFWLYTTERFFYLLELMRKKELSEVVHLESDNMLYVDVRELLPTFRARYAGMIGATFDNDQRGIGGIFYVSTIEPLERFVDLIASDDSGINDMQFLAKFRERERGRYIDHLPIAMGDYAMDHVLVSPHDHRAEIPHLYVQYCDEFASIFDAAAIGQFLGGIDPQHKRPGAGFINESCVFNPSLFKYEWIRDEQGRKVPYAIYNERKWRINNLHIHCKDLNSFTSK